MNSPIPSASNPEPFKAPATMQEVALRAGVGIGTVSRVLNNSPLVKPERAEHIRRVMAELNYTPPPLEKRQRKPKPPGGSNVHGAVGVILTGMGGLKWISDFAPIYAYTLHGVESALRSHDLACMVHHAPDLDAIKKLLKAPPRVDGFLILSGLSPYGFPEEFQRFPSVGLLGVSSNDWCDRVTYDNGKVGELAADHLLSQGILHTATIGNGNGNPLFRNRMRSFSERIAEAGGTTLNLCSESLFRAGPNFHEANDTAVAELIEQMLKSKPAVEGIFVTADMISPAVYRQLARRGIKPGRDLKIVSCNNEKAYLSHLDPQPAVIDIQAEAIGCRAVSHLVWRMQNPTAPRTTVLIDPTLIPPPR